MSRKQQRQNKIEARSKRKDEEHQHLKDKDRWTERQEARNNNNNPKAVVNQKLIGHLGHDCVDEQNHQILYDSRSFYYDIVDQGMIKIVGLNLKEQPFNINSLYFQRNLHNFLDEYIASA